MNRFQREISVAAALAALLTALAVCSPRFFEPENLRAILVSSAPVLVAAVGMTLVILTRHIDISIGSQFALCGIAAGLLAKSGLPIPLAAAGTVAIGAGLGLINGLLVSGLGLPSIVVTLATFAILREAVRWWREGAVIKDLPADFQWLGLGQEAGQWAIVAIALVVFSAFAIGLRYIRAGRAVYATGSDPEAAWLAGIRPQRVVIVVFTLMGALAGLAALLNAVRFIDIDPAAGKGLELQVIAAVVVGGVAVSGGRGTLVGPLLGVALLAVIGPGLVFLGAQPYWDKAIQGAIILVAVASESFTLGRRSMAHARLAHE